MAGGVCHHCGKDISQLRDDAKYCSDAHRQAAYRGRRSVQLRDAGKTWVRGHERALTSHNAPGAVTRGI